jgi:hypothetical protein
VASIEDSKQIKLNYNHSAVFVFQTFSILISIKILGRKKGRVKFGLDISILLLFYLGWVVGFIYSPYSKAI